MPGGRWERVHTVALVGYAAMLGLFEGPAQILCIAVVIFAVLTGRARVQRLGLFEIGILVWWLAGIPGLLSAELRPASGEWTRPLMAIAALAGAWSLDRAKGDVLGLLAWAFGGAIVLNAAYGLAQLTLGPFQIDDFFLKNPLSGQIWIPGKVHHKLAASGLYYNRLKLAHVGIVGLALLALIVGDKSSSQRARRAAGVGLAVLGPGVLYTYARAALGALAGGALGLGALKVRARVLLGVVSAAGIGVLLLLLSSVGRMRFTSLGPDMKLRLGMWKGALELAAEHPILGVGHGVYNQLIGPHLPETASGVHLTSPHNQWLQVLAETGIVGFLGFSTAIGVAFWQAARAAKSSQPENEKTLLARWTWVGLLALTLTGMTHSTLHHVPVALLFWTLAGAAGITRSRPSDGPS